MVIGDYVLFNGRRYLLIGIDPMSVTDRCADLEDLESGERVRAPLDALRDDAAADDDADAGLGKRA